MEALQRNFVFKGIPDHLLLEVRGVMLLVKKEDIGCCCCCCWVIKG
jgi:hypothetical protein